MSQTSTIEQTLLKSIEDYIDHGTNPYEMHQIAHYLNLMPSVTTSIRTKFYLLLSDMDYNKIKKTLELAEYLTIFSPFKLSQIINDDKFMEYISQTLMDSYLQEQTLNLVKLWVDEYEDSKDDINQVLTLVENLQMFDLQLPMFYDSQFKGAAAGPAGPIGNGPMDQPAEAGEPFLSPKVRDLITKAKDVVENVRGVLDSDDFDQKGKAFKVNKLQVLLSQGLSVSADLSEQKALESSTEVKQRIDTACKELKASRTRCLEKLDAVQNENRAQDQMQAQEMNSNVADKYRIVVSPTDNSAAATQSKSRTMEVDELLAYKTEQCSQGAVCPHAPGQNQPAPMQTTYNSVLHCPYWHTREDRRRAPYDSINKRVYGFGICPSSQECPKEEACAFSHNNFERLYHPLNYKKNKCEAGNACKNGKYCPYFHTLQEKKAWNHVARGYFDAEPLGADENLEKDENMQDITQWKEPDNEYNNTEDLENQGYKRSGAGVQDSVDSYAPTHGYMTGHGQSSFSRLHQHGNTQASGAWNIDKEKELKGVLHSKLIVRKKYGNPEGLSQVFHKSQVFSGFPFCYPFAPPTKKDVGGEDNEAKTESNEEKQN